MKPFAAHPFMNRRVHVKPKRKPGASTQSPQTTTAWSCAMVASALFASALPQAARADVTEYTYYTGTSQAPVILSGTPNPTSLSLGDVGKYTAIFTHGTDTYKVYEWTDGSIRVVKNDNLVLLTTGDSGYTAALTAVFGSGASYSATTHSFKVQEIGRAHV